MFAIIRNIREETSICTGKTVNFLRMYKDLESLLCLDLLTFQKSPYYVGACKCNSGLTFLDIHSIFSTL